MKMRTRNSDANWEGEAPAEPQRYKLLPRLGRSLALPILTALIVLVRSTTLSAAEKPPNIILIIADDLGYGELGCYGQRLIRTPHIDQLAADGVRFTQFYAGAPVCAPSRCTLMTGKHTGHAVVRDNRERGPWDRLQSVYKTKFTGQFPLPAEEITLAELLKQRGYATAAIGKWGLGHLGTTGAATSQGFDLFYGYYCQRHAHNHYPTFLWRNGEKELLPGNDGKSLKGQTHSHDKFIENALTFIREHRNDPFFLYLPVTIPHLSIQVPDASLQEYAGKIPEADYKHVGYLKHPTPRAGYAAMVSHLDRSVGQIVDLLKQLNLEDDTLIVFTSDNGPAYDRRGGSDSDFFNSSAGLRGRKGSVYEGGLRVPLIVSLPGKAPPAAAIHEPAAMWDMLLTLCDFAGVQPPDNVDGVSLLRVMTYGEALPEREYLYWEFPAYGGQQAIRSGDWKAVRTDLATTDVQRWQLYDLATDEAEAFDVADEYPQIVSRLALLAAEGRTDSKDFPMPFAPGPPVP
jgi:arylsulfatase A